MKQALAYLVLDIHIRLQTAVIFFTLNITRMFG